MGTNVRLRLQNPKNIENTGHGGIMGMKFAFRCLLYRNLSLLTHSERVARFI